MKNCILALLRVFCLYELYACGSPGPAGMPGGSLSLENIFAGFL